MFDTWQYLAHGQYSGTELQEFENLLLKERLEKDFPTEAPVGLVRFFLWGKETTYFFNATYEDYESAQWHIAHRAKALGSIHAARENALQIWAKNHRSYHPELRLQASENMRLFCLSEVQIPQHRWKFQSRVSVFVIPVGPAGSAEVDSLITRRLPYVATVARA